MYKLWGEIKNKILRIKIVFKIKKRREKKIRKRINVKIKLYA